MQDDEVQTTDYANKMQQLRSTYGENVLRYVRKLHHGLGHPSAETLVKTLTNAHAREDIIECAKHFTCNTCAGRRPPASAAKSGPPPATAFNDRLQMDVLYFKYGDGNQKAACLHVVDTATRFGAARLLKRETGEEVTKAFERCWVRPYGAPKRIQLDEARNFCGAELQNFLNRHAVHVDVAPGEAHTRLGVVERRHQVLREAVENYIQDEHLASV